MPDLKRVALTLVAVVLTGCAPPGGPTARFEHCQPLRGPAFGCEVRTDATTLSGSGLVWATGGAWTTEPPTYISIDIEIEKADGAGGWTGVWHHQAAQGFVQSFSTQTEPFPCGRGRYRAYMQVKFSGNNTTYYETSNEVLVA